MLYLLTPPLSDAFTVYHPPYSTSGPKHITSCAQLRKVPCQRDLKTKTVQKLGILRTKETADKYVRLHPKLKSKKSKANRYLPANPNPTLLSSEYYGYMWTSFSSSRFAAFSFSFFSSFFLSPSICLTFLVSHQTCPPAIPATMQANATKSPVLQLGRSYRFIPHINPHKQHWKKVFQT